MIDLLYQKYIETNRTICTDTRHIESGSLFFALKGESFDGNKFASDALSKGAKYAVIDNPSFQTENTILVDDTLKALQNLAHTYRKKQQFKVLALTGTNGKTTTKELIHQVLKTQYRCHATAGNFNNHIGVPLTILSASPDSELLIVEMGANHVGEIKTLCEIADPDMGLITNIGKAHLDGFGGYEGVIKAKSELYTYLIRKDGTIFYNATDSLLDSLLTNYKNKLAYGNAESGYFAQQTVFNNGITVDLEIENSTHTLDTKLFGNYNVTNILVAARIGRFFNIKLKKIATAICNYEPTNNRSQIMNTDRKNTLIIDSYNANPSSMKAAIESFNQIKAQNKVSILGGMKELGDAEGIEHSNLLELVRETNCRKIILIGKEFENCRLKSNEEHYTETENLIYILKKSPITKSLILIKGSRSNKLETIVSSL